MSETEYERRVSRGARRWRARRPATVPMIVGTTIVASLLYGFTGSWSWTSTFETAADGRPITDVQLSGAASGWGEVVILALGIAAFVVNRKRQAPAASRNERGILRLSADRLISWMWLSVAAVWVFSILQAVLAVLLVEHQVLPPFLLNGTVHLRRF